MSTENRIVLDYTSRDYKSIRSMLVGLAKGLVPEWETVGEPGDFGTLLLELYAYNGDVQNYYIDRMSSEAFLGTAVRRQSMMYIADMFGYNPVGQRAATAPMTFTWQWDTENQDPPEVTSYTITEASRVNGLVTLAITHPTFSVNVGPGQTISVSGLGTPYDGTFVVRSATTAQGVDPFTLTYAISDLSTNTASPGVTAAVSVGSVVILPAGTVISTEPDANGEAVDFELGFDIILDAADARPTTTGGTVFSISKLAAANEGRTVAPTVVGTSKGIPNAEFVLPNDGVIDRTVQVFTQEGGQVITWSEIDKLSLATPTQSVFMTYVDDEDFTHVVFGDNSSGRIPPTNVSIYVGYRYGVGEKANRLPSNSITVLRSNFAVQQGVTATNTAPPSGGADVESTESMRYSIPRANALQQRAVTLADYVSLALQVPGITKATAYGKNYSTVYVRVASTGQSTGYRTLDATHRHVASGTATLVTGSDLSMNLGQIIYVTDSGIAGLNGSQATTAVFYSNTPLEITAAVIDTNVATVTTAVSHGMKPGQPVALSGFTAGSAVFNGTFVVTATSATTFSFALTNTNLTATLNTAELATPRPGVAYTTAEANSVIATSTGTVTTLDPDMQKLIFSLESYLEDKKLIGSVVYGEPVEWADTEIDLDVVVRPLYNREAVRAAVQEAVENVFAYETVDFGKRISIGDVYRAALSVSGVDYIILTTLRPVGTAGPVVDIDDDSVGVEYDYMIPRIDPLISPTWVTATGGLANT